MFGPAKLQGSVPAVSQAIELARFPNWVQFRAIPWYSKKIFNQVKEESERRSDSGWVGTEEVFPGWEEGQDQDESFG